MRARRRVGKGDRQARRRTPHVLATGAAHRQETSERYRGLDACDRDRTRGPLLQPAASIGGLQGRRRGLQRQTRAEVYGTIADAGRGPGPDQIPDGGLSGASAARLPSCTNHKRGAFEMTMTSAPMVDAQAPAGSRQMINAIIASLLGWSLDLFDLFIL